MKLKFRILLLFAIAILMASCTGAFIVRPRPNPQTCKYCVGGWNFVCTARDFWGACYDGYYDCMRYEWLMCGSNHQPHYYRPPTHPYHPVPHHPAPHHPGHPGHGPHHPGHGPGHGPHHSASLEEEAILNKVFGEKRETLSARDLAEKIGDLSKQDMKDFVDNGNKFTDEQLLRIADKLDTTVDIVENIYENGVIVEKDIG